MNISKPPPRGSWHPTKDNLKQIFQEIDDSNANQVVLNPLAGNANDKSVIVAAFFQIPQKVGRISKSHETLSQDTISRDVARMSCGENES